MLYNVKNHKKYLKKFFLLEQCIFETHLRLEKQCVKSSKKIYICKHVEIWGLIFICIKKNLKRGVGIVGQAEKEKYFRIVPH